MSSGATPTVVFDLDGTLIDSQRDIVDSFLLAFDLVGLPRPAAAEVRSRLGKPLEVMYADLAPDERVAELSATYREQYPQHFTDHTRPYPGVVALLEELGRRGYARVVATTKRGAMARALVTAVGLDPHLEFVQGTDGFPAKPAPDVVRRAVDGVGGAGAWMVGDSVSDVLAGKAAGLRTFAVTWGAGSHDDLAASEPDALEPDLGALLELLPAVER